MRLYHISSDNIDEKILDPRIPNNILTKIGAENNTIPRISFATEIKYALLAIGSNRLENGLKILYVFEPTDYKKIKILTDKEISEKGYVPDVEKTKEHWILNKTKVKYCGKIQLLNKTNKFIEIKFGSLKIKNYFWNYKVLDGDIS